MTQLDNRQAALYGNTGIVEVMHGADVVLLLAHLDGYPASLILEPDQARRLARILFDQAEAVSERHPDDPDLEGNYR